MSNLIFMKEAWDDYIYWQNEDKRTLRKINIILHDISRSSFEGIGKPEPLKGDISGWWSRRIDDTNRIVYRIRDSENIEIAQCKGHYHEK